MACASTSLAESRFPAALRLAVTNSRFAGIKQTKDCAAIRSARDFGFRFSWNPVSSCSSFFSFPRAK